MLIKHKIIANTSPQICLPFALNINQGDKKSFTNICHRMLSSGKEIVHVESCVLLQRVSNTRSKEITLDVEMEDYHRIKNRTEVTADAKE